MRALKTVTTMYQSRSYREKLLIGVVAACAVVFFSSELVNAVSASISDNERLVQRRVEDLDNTTRLLRSYTRLEAKLRQLQQTYAGAEMSLEEVTNLIDTVVKEAIGSPAYDLSRAREVTELDIGYEKQEFNLKIQAITLDQLIKLLHAVESGNKPVFLGKVNVDRATDTTFRSTIELFTIRRKNA